MSAPRPTRLRGEALAWIGLLVTLAVPIGWGADARYPWDVDNIAPGSVLKVLAAHFGAGWYSSYGPLSYLVTAAVYLPLLGLFRLFGELSNPSATYPWGFVHPERSMAALVVAARLVTVGFALASVALAQRRATAPARERTLASPAPGWAVPLLALGSPLFCYYARTSNVDVHYLFWLALAFHLVESAPRSVARLALAAACASLALSTKEQAAPLALVAGGAALVRAWRLGRGDGARGVRAVALVALAGALAYALVWPLPWNLAGWREHLHFVFSQARYPRSFPPTLAGFAALGARTIQQLPLALGALMTAAVVVALLLRTSWRGLKLRAVACAFYLVTFLGAIGYVYPRFLLPLLLVALPLSARAMRDLFRLARSVARDTRPVGALAVTLALAGGPALSLVMLTEPRLAAERWMRAHLAPDAVVEIAGNPHYQVRVGHQHPRVYVTADSLRRAPRGPRADVVLLSSIDQGAFESDSIVKRAWRDSLVPPPAGHYVERLFRPGPLARLIRGLPVAPVVRLYVRADSLRR